MSKFDYQKEKKIIKEKLQDKRKRELMQNGMDEETAEVIAEFSADVKLRLVKIC